MTRVFVLLVCFFLVIGLGEELVQNGDFENSLSHWEVDYNNNMGSWQARVDTSYHPDSDHEVYVYKYDRHYAKIRQTVDLPSTDAPILFSTSAKLYSRKISGSNYYAYATLTLLYLNSAGSSMGKTMIVHKTPLCNLQNTPEQHIIEAVSTGWEYYTFNIWDELANLPGVNAPEVAKIRIELEGHCTSQGG